VLSGKKENRKTIKELEMKTATNPEQFETVFLVKVCQKSELLKLKLLSLTPE
jgi:hypothetical protein